MRLRRSGIILMLACALFLTAIPHMDALAGLNSSTYSSKTAENAINTAAWYITDNSIAMKDEKIVISADGSTVNTSMIGKMNAKLSDGMLHLIKVSADASITKLPAQQKFILAYGLNSIEAKSGTAGNVELVFTNENGIKLTIIAYTADGAVTILNKTSCGIGLNSRFNFSSEISEEGLLDVSINGRKICSKLLPVSGEGRFGVLQTGSCGAEFYELDYTTYEYVRPENTNIDVDFEAGEWNANLVTGRMSNAASSAASMAIKSLDDNQVLWFKEAKIAWFATNQQYSNFELTFDIPYFQKTYERDEDGNITLQASGAVGIGFGEEEQKPTTNATGTDYFLFDAVSAKSSLKDLWSVNYADIGLSNMAGGEKDNIGYSVKLTVVDKRVVVQVKPLNSKNYTTIADVECADFRTGYVRIQTNTVGNFAIDNFKLTNLDSKPNLIEVEYKSSVMNVEDYELTEADTEMVFRPGTDEDKKTGPNLPLIIIGSAVGIVIVFILALTVVYIVKKKSGRKVQKNENEENKEKNVSTD